MYCSIQSLQVFRIQRFRGSALPDFLHKTSAPHIGSKGIQPRLQGYLLRGRKTSLLRCVQVQKVFYIANKVCIVSLQTVVLTCEITCPLNNSRDCHGSIEGDENNKDPEAESSVEATRQSIRKTFGAGVIIVHPLTPGKGLTLYKQRINTF